MTDAIYPNDASPESQAGLATNYASDRWAVFHQDKVRKIPDWVATQQAAAYTLAAQAAL